MKLLIVFLSLILAPALTVVAQTMPKNADAKVISSPPFHLSDEAIAAGIDGRIAVRLAVDKTGRVKNIYGIAGPAWPCGSNPKNEIRDVLDTVRKTILSTQFSPTIKNGTPVDSDLSFSFLIGNAYRDAVKRREAEVEKEAALPKIVDSGVLRGMALSLPKPEYPSGARMQRLSGVIPIEVLINEQGRVVLAGAVDGHPLLQTSARDSACGAKFSPTLLKGDPVKVNGVITYTFVP